MNGRVLVVEDDPAIRMLTKTVLEGRGYAVIEACDGPSALPIALESSPDVILLDVGLPGMDGFGVLGLLKENDATCDTPVLMVTAWAEPDLIARALDNGAHDYVRKPFDIGELSARVDAAARIKARQDALHTSNERLTEMATVDLLTGIPNRVKLTEDLRRQVSSARRSGRPFSVIMMDLDRFKAVNDTHGHAIGDQLLAAVAARLGERVRGSDVLGRWGGEEFVILVPDTALGGAGALAEDLRSTLASAPLELEDGSVPATASFGVAEWDHEGFEDTLARADAALYEAKSGGRNTVRLAATQVTA